MKRQYALQTAGSLSAGLLIGMSFVTPAFAAAGMESHPWTTYLGLGSMILLVVGIMLQAVVTAEPPRNMGPEVFSRDAFGRDDLQPSPT